MKFNVPGFEGRFIRDAGFRDDAADDVFETGFNDAAWASLIASLLRQKSMCALKPSLSVSSVLPQIGQLHASASVAVRGPGTFAKVVVAGIDVLSALRDADEVGFAVPDIGGLEERWSDAAGESGDLEVAARLGLSLYPISSS